MLKSNLFSKEDGFTLIEIVISMLILAMLVLFYVSSTTTSFSGTQIAGEKTIALNLARQKIEEIKANNNKTTQPSSNVALSTVGYTYDLAIAPFQGSSRIYSVTVTVHYIFNSKNQDLSLSTLIF